MFLGMDIQLQRMRSDDVILSSVTLRNRLVAATLAFLG